MDRYGRDAKVTTELQVQIIRITATIVTALGLYYLRNPLQWRLLNAKVAYQSEQFCMGQAKGWANAADACARYRERLKP